MTISNTEEASFSLIVSESQAEKQSLSLPLPSWSRHSPHSSCSRQRNFTGTFLTIQHESSITSKTSEKGGSVFPVDHWYRIHNSETQDRLDIGRDFQAQGRNQLHREEPGLPQPKGVRVSQRKGRLRRVGGSRHWQIRRDYERQTHEQLRVRIQHSKRLINHLFNHFFYYTQILYP